jgi:hypothetical protein
MTEINPNSFDKEIEEAQKPTPEAPQPEGTEQKETVTTEQPHKVEEVDYRKKFIDSAKGAQQLLKEKQELEAENARLKSEGKPPVRPDIADELPGFESMDQDQQDSLVAYTNVITKRTREEIYRTLPLLLQSRPTQRVSSTMLLMLSLHNSLHFCLTRLSSRRITLMLRMFLIILRKFWKVWRKSFFSIKPKI